MKNGFIMKIPNDKNLKSMGKHGYSTKIFRKYSVEILQEPCNVRSKHYKWNVAAILIFHCNIAVMSELSSSFV